MSHALSIRALRQALLAQSTSSSVDEVEIEALRQDIARTVQEIRQSMNRALDFASRGLVSEAAALVDDFPDLAGEALGLTTLPASDPVIARVWNRCVDPTGPLAWIADAMPRETEIDAVAMQTARMAELRTLLDEYRSSALRQEPVVTRLKLLRKLRALDENNRMWLDQIQALETEWLKWAVERSRAESPKRDELEGILSALTGHEWLASLPRGLKDDVYARLKPMRAETAGQRYAEIADRVHAAGSNLDWDEIRRLEAEWAGVYHDTGRMPDDALQAQVQVAFDGLTARDEERRQVAEFEGLCDALERELNLHPPSARSPNEPAIEQALQAVRDRGMMAPAGLVERAIAHLESIADAKRRRFRIMLVSALSAAAAVAVALGVAIRIQSLRAAEESSRTTLIGHTEGKRWEDGQAHAARIRDSFGSPDPETLAALDAHDRGYAAWAARQVEIDATLKSARGRLGLGLDPAAPAPEVDRALHAAVKAQVEAVRADVESEEHRGWLGGIDGKLKESLASLDERDRKRATEALAACDRSLEAWKSPDRWTPSQKIDVKRWADYEKALTTASAALLDVRNALNGFPDGEADLTRRLDGLGESIREAKARQVTLVEAERSLAPEAIGKPVSLEEDFISRLDDARKRFGDVLAIRGQLTDWEASLALANAWRALQDWREGAWPRLSASLKGDFGRAPNPDSAAAAIAILDEYLGKHPDTPLRARVEELKSRIEPGQIRNLWAAADLHAALERERLASIERVEIVNGKGRYFFRRHFEKNTKPVNNAIQSLDDLGKEPMSDNDIARQIRDSSRLSSVQLKPGEFAGAPSPDPVSLAWDDAQFRAQDGTAAEVATRLVTLIQRLRDVTDADAFLQLYALVKASEMLESSGHLPPELKPALDAWKERLRTDWIGARRMDWARAAIQGPLENQKERQQAADALKNFPDVRRFLKETADAKLKIADSLGPFAPIGVLLPADGDGVRRIRDSKLKGDVVLVRAVVGKTGAFELVDAKCDSGAIDVGGLAVPKGPLLVFRRISR